ncbi:hypothetical protein ADICEAN_02147 [Cesiribacter andamanensis AMV16]|uniref:Outer membrane protein beta-barrel domain-containing protein n=2 Tax=Cesiribacter TaxID=1133570 RepID=M7NLT2_9BACT|nr:hypothetical protein ADICEAN_02147 [Cesiribacter andamanensis AMV16]
MRPLLLLLFTLGSLASLQAQTPSPSRYLVTGLSANNYRGDLEDGIAQYKPALHLGLKLNRSRRLNGNFELSLGQVEGQDPHFAPLTEAGIQPNRYFSSTFFAANFMLHYNLLQRERYLLYLGQGIGLFRYNPLDEEDQSLQDRRPSRLGTEEYGNISLMLPTALGAVYFLPNHWGIGLQAAYLHPLTDYLDNISELGSKKGNDNVLQFRLQLLLPIHGALPREN